MAPLVEQLWRYPVKSFQGIRSSSLEVGPSGVAGDRAWGVVSADGELVLSAKRTAALLEASADDDGLTLPDGTRLSYGASGIDEALSVWLGQPVALVRASEAGPVSYEMTFDPPNDDAVVVPIPTPEGSLTDLAPIHLLTRATLEGCARARPELAWDVRRFRPNIVVAIEADPFVEDSWAGRRLRVGEAVLRIDQPTVRCALPLRAQPAVDGAPALARQPALFHAVRELNETTPGHLGVYASVVEEGTVRDGDPVELLDT